VWLALQVGCPLTEGWILLSVFLYLLTGASWLPVVWVQMRMRNLATAAARDGSALPDDYRRLFCLWFAFGFPAFAAVLAILAHDPAAVVRALVSREVLVVRSNSSP
jgi:uncharacterized membrane protein